MASVSAVPRLMTNMRTALAAVLPGVVVTSGLVMPSAGEHLMLLEVPEGGQQWQTLGNRAREEEGLVCGRIYVAKAGVDETTITAARDRAYVLLGTLEAVLVADPTWGGAVRTSWLSRHDMGQAAINQARACEIDFELSFKVRLR